ncbi:MAG TPA: CHRD domain-containing protein [Streptosporangiaceae bacterium]|nr:CHRD domain-containing protein [Streptosporangiaceae bacterium]
MTQRRRLFTFAVAMGAAGTVIAGGSAATASNGSHSVPVNVHEQLSGYEETPLAVSTTGTGRFRAQINEGKQQIRYTLSYSGLEGTVTQAHIHFGSESQTGGISVFLCSNLGNGPEGTQACPAAPGTVSGTVTPANVIGPSAQGIAAGEFAELLRALRAGATYVNVHSTLYPVGEIRGQIDHH